MCMRSMEIEKYQEIGHFILIKNLPNNVNICINNVPYFSPIYMQYTSCAECREIGIICKNGFFIFTCTHIFTVHGYCKQEDLRI
ncbi:hypothetical protein T01_15164 [Trichinella spiralis]|uniref:Uncharacterized protein n=1 Tax=Trichinella spiralis TaxID=6334 RepID=A0A0V1AW89_TRISP|nr:hypothetical protein T01_15164 [Trichinella spiralis]